MSSLDVRGEGPVAVEGVVDIDDAALSVRRDRDAAAHVGHDQVRFFVGPAHAAAVQARDGLLVQGMEDRLARAHRHTRDAGCVVHLIDHRGIGYVGFHARHVGDLRREQSPEVAGVLHRGVAQVVAHPGVDLVDSGGDGAYQSSAADHGRQIFQVERLFAQGREDQSPAPVELVDDIGESGDFFGRVAQGQIQQRPLLVVEGDLRGC